MIEKDMEIVEKYLGVFLGKCECKDAWLRIKKDYMELAQQAHNTQTMPCPKWHLGGKCCGDPWKEVCPKSPCRVTQP